MLEKAYKWIKATYVFSLSNDVKIIGKKWKKIWANKTSFMVMFYMLLLNDKRVISKEGSCKLIRAADSHG